MHIIPLKALTDNYIWLLHDDDGHALVVDPGEADGVEQALAKHQLQLRAILLTHHHDDHIGAAAALRQRHQVPVYAPHDPRIECATHTVVEGSHVDLNEPAVHFEVWEIPGHTLSHVAYVGEGIVFSGDTLFSLGCGRLFEGTPAQMLASLDRIAALPGETLVCCGHEYTAANARFAQTIEPDNAALLQRSEDVSRLRAQNLPTLPSTIASENACNPFLRVDSPALVSWANTAIDRVSRFAALRSAKDNFRS